MSQLGLSLNILIYKSHEHKYSLVVVVVSSVLVVVVVSSVLVVVVVSSVLVVVVVVVVLLLVGGTTVELVPVEVDDVAPVEVVVIVGVLVVGFGPEGWAARYIDIYTYETYEKEQIDFYKVCRNTIIKKHRHLKKERSLTHHD